MTRRTLIAFGGGVGLVVMAVLGLRVLVDPNQYRSTLEQRMTAALGRPVTLGRMHLSVVSRSLIVDDVSIGDDPAFSKNPFLTASSVRVGVDLMPLIFSKAVQVRSIHIEAPKVVLLRSPAGAWSYSSLGAASSGTTEAEVGKLRLAGGQITVAPTGSLGKGRVYTDVGVDATDLSYRAAFPFKVHATTPGGGTIVIRGTAGPIDAIDVAKTSMKASVTLTNVDLGVSGVFGPAAGINGVLDLTAVLDSDGRHTRLTGTARTTRLQLVRGSPAARVPIDVAFDSDYDKTTRRGVLKPGDVHIGQALARLGGTYDLTGETALVRMTLSGRHMPVPAVEASLPAVGIVLPPGAALAGGTLDTDLIIAGLLDRLVITGPAEVSNARIAGFDLRSKMGSLASFGAAGPSGDTAIETLKAGLRIAADGMQAQNILVVMPAIGSMTGHGVIAPTGAIHFVMLGRMNAGNAANVAGDVVSRATGFGLPSSNGIPFRIEGTTANPVFVPDVGATVRSFANAPGLNLNPATGTAGLLDELLGRRKK
jgi:AsmA protein